MRLTQTIFHIIWQKFVISKVRRGGMPNLMTLTIYRSRSLASELLDVRELMQFEKQVLQLMDETELKETSHLSPGRLYLVSFYLISSLI